MVVPSPMCGPLIMGLWRIVWYVQLNSMYPCSLLQGSTRTHEGCIKTCFQMHDSCFQLNRPHGIVRKIGTSETLAHSVLSCGHYSLSWQWSHNMTWWTWRGLSPIKFKHCPVWRGRRHAQPWSSLMKDLLGVLSADILQCQPLQRLPQL